MNRQKVLQGIVTITLLAVSLFLLTAGSALLLELGKGILFLSVISLFPLSQAMARTQVDHSKSINMETRSMEKQEVA